MTALSVEEILGIMKRGKEGRGMNVYHLTDTMGINALDRTGKVQNVTYERPLFSLTIDERIQMAKYSAMVFGVISSRMNRIGALEWNVIRETDEEDRRIETFENLANIHQEWADVMEPGAMVTRALIHKRLKQYMPELRWDMANFQQSIMRYRKRIRSNARYSAKEVKDWLIEPNPDYSLEEFLKTWIWDLHTHGAFAIYKQSQNGIIENLYALPGGTVLPVRNRYVGGVTAYVQLIPTESTPQIFFNDEVSFSRWMPTTASSYGLVPLEALVNKVAEQMLFDEQAAQQADGTKPPEKIVVFGDSSPFGNMDRDFELPLEKEEQRKIEIALNEKRQHAIRTLSGVGMPVVLDLSKSDLFANQSERQRQLKEDVALVFNATNNEMNMTGGDTTSGRATSETEERTEMKRGIVPILKIIEEKINRDILPFRYGPGYRFEFSSGMSEFEEIELMTKRMQSGVYSVNEVRSMLGEDPYPESQYDRPQSQSSQPSEQNSVASDNPY